MRGSPRILAVVILATALPLASCGSDTVTPGGGTLAILDAGLQSDAGLGPPANPASLPGSWREIQTFPGIGADMTLLVDGTGAVAGTGVSHIEAGPDQPFTVTGTVQSVDWHFTNAALGTVIFGIAQPDRDHLQLFNSQGVETFVREP